MGLFVGELLINNTHFFSHFKKFDIKLFWNSLFDTLVCQHGRDEIVEILVKLSQNKNCWMDDIIQVTDLEDTLYLDLYKSL